MSLFSLRKGSERVGTLIDIGSGSVLIAIVISNTNSKEPTIIWSHREHSPLRNIETIEQSAKAVLTALVNALIKFDGEGRQALAAVRNRSTIDSVQCCIAAPWSYTVTKSINYTQPEPFLITKTLIEELIDSAEKKIAEELDSAESTTELGLTIVARATMDLLANGYQVKHTENQHATSLSLAHASVVTQKYLVDELNNLRDKLFPAAELRELSHMLAFYGVSNDILPLAADTCLIDVTYEATEIGIVREGALRYATHTPFGSFSLAREIANITDLPLYEAFKHLHTPNPDHFLDSLPAGQRAEVEKVFEAYVQRLSELFHETGDDLSIPKQILVHCDLETEVLFTRFIESAATTVLKSAPVITMTTPAILKQTFPTELKNINNDEKRIDTGMLLSALFFHKQNSGARFEYF